MDNDQAEQARREALEDAVQRAGAFEVMVQTKGWEHIQTYYQSRVQALASAILLQDNRDLIEFENERRELIGLRKLLNFIDNDLTTLANERANNQTGESSSQ